MEPSPSLPPAPSLPINFSSEPGAEHPGKILQQQVRLAAKAHHPGDLAISLWKFQNVAFSCATASLIRTFLNRPKPVEPSPEQAAVPSWMQEDFKRKTSSSQYMRQYFRDMGLLIGCSYLMEGIERGMEELRGTKDQYNKMVGGTAAGGVLAFSWYPRQPVARLAMVGTGTLVGYMSSIAENTSRRYLLDRQHKLEQELLGLPPPLQQKDLDTTYLHELLRIHQRKLRDSGTSEKEVKANELQQLLQQRRQQELQMQEQQQGSSSTGLGGGMEESAAAATAPVTTQGEEPASLTFKDEFSPPDSSVGAASEEQLPDFAEQRPDNRGF